jgi:hypothetical protein
MNAELDSVALVTDAAIGESTIQLLGAGYD